MNKLQARLNRLFGDQSVFRSDWTRETRSHLSPHKRVVPKSPLYMIGRTPMVDVSFLSENRNVRLYAKVESRNLLGSIKDRVALQMVGDAIWDRRLMPGMTLLEATSGNTGTALAALGKMIGFSVELVIPQSVSKFKREQMLSFGAKLTVVEGHTTETARQVAVQRSRKDQMKYFLTDQYSNPSNPRAHYYSTAPEVLRQCPRVSHVVAAQGSFGTLRGISNRMRRERRAVEMHAVVAKPGERTIYGIKEVNDVAPLVDNTLLSGRHMVDGRVAMRSVTQATHCGLTIGPSSGAVLAAAIKLSSVAADYSNIVCVLPDGGEKYDLSSLKKTAAKEIDHTVFLNW